MNERNWWLHIRSLDTRYLDTGTAWRGVSETSCFHALNWDVLLNPVLMSAPGVKNGSIWARLKSKQKSRRLIDSLGPSCEANIYAYKVPALSWMVAMNRADNDSPPIGLHSQLTREQWMICLWLICILTPLSFFGRKSLWTEPSVSLLPHPDCNPDCPTMHVWHASSSTKLPLEWGWMVVSIKGNQRVVSSRGQRVDCLF